MAARAFWLPILVGVGMWLALTGLFLMAHGLLLDVSWEVGRIAYVGVSGVSASGLALGRLASPEG
jgi:hypothetical protein